jgi:very-short-patch-repair endonuclease
MGRRSHPQERAAAAWALAEHQHGVVSRTQLASLGYTGDAIAHRVARGRLHRKARGVFAVGRPELSRLGAMMVGVLACGPGAAVSHETAGELWGLRRPSPGPIELSIPRGERRSRPGIVVHRRTILEPGFVTTHQRVPVTCVPLVLVDIAARLSERHLEAAVNMADSLDLLDPERLRLAIERFPCVAGVAPLRSMLDRHSFRLTESELERMFRSLVASMGLPPPITQRYLSGHRVDFVWPDIALVVETDSLRYHRTALQQSRDAARDHDHLLAGRESVRFTHYQVAYQRPHVKRTLRAAWARTVNLRSLAGPVGEFGVPEPA